MREQVKNRDRRIRQEVNWPTINSPVVSTDMRIDAYARLGGGSATAATRAVGASGSIVAPVLDFPSNADTQAFFMIYAPEDLAVAYPCHLEVVWVPGASYTSGNFSLNIDYLIKNEEESLATGAPTTLTMDITPTDAVTTREDRFSTDIYLSSVDTIIYCRFWRDVSEDNGDDGAEVLFWEFGYKAYRAGSKMHPAQKPW